MLSFDLVVCLLLLLTVVLVTLVLFLLGLLGGGGLVTWLVEEGLPPLVALNVIWHVEHHVLDCLLGGLVLQFHLFDGESSLSGCWS